MLIRQISNFKLEAGCDEAGRGCLAGPVVAAAVILKEDFSNPLLNDSKKLTEKHRLLLKDEIEKEAKSEGLLLALGVYGAIGVRDNSELGTSNPKTLEIAPSNEYIVKILHLALQELYRKNKKDDHTKCMVVKKIKPVEPSD